jgi:hypothetical protein
LPVPVTTVDRLNIAGSSSGWSKDIYLNPNTHGASIKKIVTAVFNNTETAGSAYEHDNTDGRKVRSYRTMINDNPIQQFPISCRTENNEAYLLHKKMLEKSSILNQNMFEYFSFHCDDWSGNTTNKDKIMMTGMENTSQKYTFSCDTPGTVTQTGNHNVYSIIVGVKFMRLKEGESFMGLTAN